MGQLPHGTMLAILLTVTMSTLCKGQLRVQFTEKDYSSTANASSIQLLISKTGNNNGNIIIRLLPLTFAGYAQLPTTQCDSVVSKFDSSDPAEEDDFDSTVLEQIIPPSQTGISTTYTFNVSLRPDNVLEETEAFVIFLNITSENVNDVVESSRMCAVIKINEPSFTGPLVDFVRNGVVLSPNIADPLMLPEDNGVEMLLTVDKVIDTELPIRVTVTSRVANSVREGSDFIVPVKSIDILPEESSTNISINIIDDGLAEALEMFTVSVHASPVGHVFSARQDIEVEIMDNEVVTIGIKNSEDVITITEGESATVIVGLINFEARNYVRYAIALDVSTVDGTAIVGEDYRNFKSLFRPFLSDQDYSIESIKRVGIEPPRNFVFEFVRDPPPLTRFERRNITIIITDSSKAPLAPSINNLIWNNSEIVTSWTQEIPDDHPVDNFIIIIKPCSSSPCEIQDPQMPKDDELEYLVNKNLSVYLLTSVESRMVHEVVVCAINALGRNCSVPIFLESDPNTEFDVPLAPSIVNLSLMTKDSMIETSWTHEITDDRPIDNFIIIIKACSSTPCEIEDPYMPEEDEDELQVNKNVLVYRLTGIDPSKVHVVVVCANNSLGKNCSVPIFLEKDPNTEFDVPLAPSIVNLSLMTKDSMIETSWTHEITEYRPIDNFIIIIKACSSTPCEIEDPYMPEEDEDELQVNKNVLVYRLTGIDPSKVHVVVVCANNSLGKNCSVPIFLEKDPNTEFDVPLAPSIVNLFLMTKDSMIETSWTHEITDYHPIDNFIIIIKACSSTPCEIKNPYMPEEDEDELQVNKNVLVYRLTGIDPSKVHVVVVCANNSLGKNCSVPIFLERDPNTEFDVPLAPSIDNLSVIMKDSMIETSWTHEITDYRSIDNFIIIIKACSSTPCEIKNPYMPEEDEDEFQVNKNVLVYQLTGIDTSKVHVIVVCANNSLGKNCSTPSIIENSEREEQSEQATKQPLLLIIGILLVGVLILLFFLIVFLLIFFYCRWSRSRVYFPGKSIGNQIKGTSMDSNLEESHILNMKYF